MSGHPALFFLPPLTQLICFGFPRHDRIFAAFAEEGAREQFERFRVFWQPHDAISDEQIRFSLAWVWGLFCETPWIVGEGLMAIGIGINPDIVGFVEQMIAKQIGMNSGAALEVRHKVALIGDDFSRVPDFGIGALLDAFRDIIHFAVGVEG